MDKLKQLELTAAFDLEVHNRLDVLDSVDSVEGTWSNFKTTVAQAADGVVGYRRAPGKRGGSQMTLGKLLMKGKEVARTTNDGADR